MYLGFRWFVALVMFIVTASTSLILIAPIAVVGSITEASGMTPPTIMTLTMSVFNLFIVVAVMLGGALIDKFGVNKIYIGGLLVVILGNMVAYVAGNSTGGLFISRALQGLGTGPIMASIALLARQWFKEHEHGIVTGLQGMAVSVGIAAGFLLAPRLAEHSADWTEMFIAISGINLVGVGLTLIVVFGSQPNVLAAPTVQTDAPPSQFKLFRPLIIIGGLCFFGGTWMQQSVNTIGPGFIGSELGMGQLTAADLMFYYAIAFAIGSPISGVIAGIWLKGKKDHLVIAFSFLVSCLFSFFILHISSVIGLVVCLFILGIFQSFINPIVMSFIARTYPHQVIGRVTGFSMTFSFVAGVLSPYVCSLILTMTETYSASFICMAIVSAVGIFFALKLQKKSDSLQ